MKEDSSGQVQLKNKITEMVNQGALDSQGCTHLMEIQDVTPSAAGCEKCLQIGDDWVHLRLCLICGHVGCCDNSKNKHATKHFHETSHSMIVSYEPDERWLWCYVDELPFQP